MEMTKKEAANEKRHKIRLELPFGSHLDSEMKTRTNCKEAGPFQIKVEQLVKKPY